MIEGVKPAFIAGDWGTTRLRLFLCAADGAVLERREGPGIAAAGGHAADAFAQATQGWDAGLPAMLGGMVGSTIGWHEVAYVPCPAPAAAIASRVHRFESGDRAIALAPGLSCRNASGLPDVMRGEETQILGALRLNPALAQGRHLLCLPGTHAKWVLLEGGVVTTFQTALSGELFALLSTHSVLARDGGTVDPTHPGFALGARTAREESKAGLLHLLFSTRSRQLAGELSKAEAASYLSGLIIGEDVAAALRLFAPKDSVTLICAPALAALYAYVLGDYAVASTVIDGDAAALAGLICLHDSVFGHV